MEETRFKKELETFKKLGFLNQYNLSNEEVSSLPTKYSVRSVVLLENNKMILIKVSRDNYHSVVGGEVEEGESLEEAIIRESREESGYDVEIIRPIGYLDYWKRKYKKLDFGFLVKVIGSQKPLLLTEQEIEIGHEVSEHTTDESIFILENDIKMTSCPVSERSLVFLKEAQKYLKNMVK